MSTDASTDRGPRPDEPDVPYFIISGNGATGTGQRRLHIPAAGGNSPICEHEVHRDGSEWNAKSIKTRPPSWREGRWCERCIEIWKDTPVEDEGGVTDYQDSRKIPSTRVDESLYERVESYCERMGLRKGELVRRCVQRYLTGGDREKLYTETEMKDALRDLADELGRPPSTADIDNAEGVPSAARYYERWQGGISEAREEADVGHPDKGHGKGSAINIIQAYEYVRANPSASRKDVCAETNVGKTVARRVMTAHRKMTQGGVE